MIRQQLLPDWQAAQRHALASNIGKCPSSMLYPEVCECCQNPIQQQPISLGANVKNLHFLGFGVPLFYHFLQGCIILNLLLIVTDHLASLVTAHTYSSKLCYKYLTKYKQRQTHQIISFSFGLLPSILRSEVHPKFEFDKADDSQRVICTKLLVFNAQIQRDLSVEQKISRVCSFFIHGCCLIFIKSKITKRKNYYNQIYHHLADYSVIFKELNQKTPDKASKMRQFITGFGQKNNTKFDVQRVLIIPENQQLEFYLVKHEEILAQCLRFREEKNQQEQQKWKLLENIKIKIEEEVTNTKDQLILETNETKTLIVIFERKANKIEFLRRVPGIRSDPTFAHFFGDPADIVIESCPNPKEITWTNLKYTRDRPFKIFFGWFLSLLFLMFTFVLFYLLQTYKTHFIREAFFMTPESEGAEKRKRRAMLLAWATWLGIILYNKFVMAPVLDFLTKLERHDNVSHEDFSFAFKYALGMFFTSSIMKIVVETTQFNNYYRQDFGIIEEESLMFVFSAVFLPLLWAVHPNRLAHLLRRWFYYGRECVTQGQANELMAEYPYFVGKRYAEIIEMMWFTYLYTELIPLGGFLMLFGQCMYYWIDKYNLLRRSSLNYTVGVALSDKMLRLLDLTLFWRFLGSFVFDLSLRQQIHPSTMVLLGVSIVYALLPWESILDFFDHEEFNVSEVPYSTLQKTEFKENTYEAVNALNKFIQCGVPLKRRTSFLSYFNYS